MQTESTPVPSSPCALRSFRDPSGQVFETRDRILRVVNRGAQLNLNAALHSPTVQRFMDLGRVVKTWGLPRSEQQAWVEQFKRGSWLLTSDISSVLEHEKIFFPSFAFEWPAEMLWEAAALTLELAQALVGEGLGLKDALATNIFFKGPRPIFIDFLSFEKRVPCDPIWRAQSQFAQTFLNPLLANRYFSVPLDAIFFRSRNGIHSESIKNLCGPFRRWFPPFLNLITLPALFSSQPQSLGIYEPFLVSSQEKADYILRALLARQAKHLKKLTPRAERSSFWTGYMDSANAQTAPQLEQKETFLKNVMAAQNVRRVLDVGANSGHFSELAAQGGAEVVAIDSDPVVVGRLWKRAAQKDLSILPLVVNLAAPSPALGWKNQECPSFLERAEGAFDLVVLYAVLHHLLAQEAIALPRVLELVKLFTKAFVVMEFVSPTDPGFEKMARGRDFSYLSKAYFEACVLKEFEIVYQEKGVQGDRTLYFLKKRTQV